MGITTDLGSDLLCCDLGRKNDSQPKRYVLDLIFSNSSADITIEISKSPLLGLDRHHRAYEMLVDVRLCENKATSVDERRFRFRAADYEALTDALGLVDWHDLFSCKGVNLCVDLFYDVIWSCFENFVPRTSTRCVQELPWVTKELNELKNKTTKAGKSLHG
jgi:hypothetical protein